MKNCRNKNLYLDVLTPGYLQGEALFWARPSRGRSRTYWHRSCLSVQKQNSAEISDLTAELQAGPEHQRFPVFGGPHAGSYGPGIRYLGHLGGPQWHRVNRPAPSPNQERSGHSQPDHQGRCHCLAQWKTHTWWTVSHTLTFENMNMQKTKFHTRSVKVDGPLFHQNLMG